MSRLIRTVFSRRTLGYVTGGTAIFAAGGYWYLNSGPAYPQSTKEKRRPPPPWTPPSRQSMLDALKASGRITTLTSSPGASQGEYGEEFDLLIVGGGATGAGVAVDAATRGLKVALVERNDFSSGTSSKSTKLVHGGVRYLQKAVMELDYEQYKLVREALHERKIFLQTAPYLSDMLPIMLPIYKYWQVPYYWAGCKMYDILAGKENMETSYVMSKGKALETFPMLKSDGLVGALVYYDGQHNDARMNIALIMTAVKHGATVANYCEVTNLRKGSDGKLNGARVKDYLTGEEFNVRAKGVINATGPFSDALLSMDNPQHKPIVQPSSGIHITLPNYYSPRRMGLLDPATSDGRVIFFLPWQGNTIAGTTDSPAQLTNDPRASEDEIRWVLDEIRHYLSPDIKVRRGDVLSAWSGLRPLVRSPNASSTEGLVRNHMIHVSEDGLLTIAGGKWTTYRSMAEETVDLAVKTFSLEGKVKTNGCVTETVRLVGSDGWSRNMFIGLIQRFGLETEVAKHLSDNYGDRAWTVCSLAEPTNSNWPLHGIKLNSTYPYIEAEVRYAVRHEYAQTAIDVLARRTRLCFLNVQAANDALPRVVDIMAEELGWSKDRKKDEIKKAEEFFISSMGLLKRHGLSEQGVIGSVTALWNQSVSNNHDHEMAHGFSRSQFSVGELEALKSAFDKRAVVPTAATAVATATSTLPTEPAKVKKAELGEIFKEVSGYGYEGVSKSVCEYVLDEAGFNKRGELDFDEFVEVCSNVKEVAFTPVEDQGKIQEERRTIPVEKSGGGV